MDESFADHPLPPETFPESVIPGWECAEARKRGYEEGMREGRHFGYTFGFIAGVTVGGCLFMLVFHILRFLFGH